VSITGSAIVFRNEVYQSAPSGPRIVPVGEKRLTKDELRAAVHNLYPTSSLSYIWDGKQPNYATEVWLEYKGKRNQRLFDPYTGADLGPSIAYRIQWFAWFADIHTNLLYGKTGRFVNGIGSILLTLLCVSGFIIWWPGVKNWRRSLMIDFKSNWKRLNWDLHSAVGFWSFALIFMWAVTGIFLVWPLPFQKAVNHFSPLIQYRLPDDETAQLRTRVVLAQETTSPVRERGGFKGRGPRQPIRRSNGDIFLRWLYYLHFGNFAGWKTKALWVVLGFIPPLLFVTGAIMWWNRVLSPRLRRSSEPRAEEEIA